MKKIISLAVILVAILFTGGCSLYGNNQTGAPNTAPAPTTTEPSAAQGNINAVNIENFSFTPGALNVKKGESVTWANNDPEPHAIKSAGFSSEILNKGQSFSFTFNQTGTFKYFCSLHPSMTGEIIVK
ncbi:MAG: cupredoxin family copper-binding protein [Patescibacteria group bacterium]|jgi:plastocyanin